MGRGGYRPEASCHHQPGVTREIRQEYTKGVRQDCTWDGRTREMHIKIWTSGKKGVDAAENSCLFSHAWSAQATAEGRKCVNATVYCRTCCTFCHLTLSPQAALAPLVTAPLPRIPP